MIPAMQHILKHLFHVESLAQVPRERLEELVEQYPSFGIARYLLSHKLKAENAGNFSNEAQRTNLYFTNPLWLHWLLQNTDPSAPANGSKSPASFNAARRYSIAREPIPPVETEISEAAITADQDLTAPTETDAPIPDEESITVIETESSSPEAASEAPAEPAIPKDKEPPPATGSTAQWEPAFEPYYTIDYFASQGIKLSLDEQGSDKLGRQLKSFTEWLKVMRRLPQQEKEAAPDLAIDPAVQSIAAHSIEGREVVTETMADVLVKQGMYAKAAEVYQKLSLLNPGKMAYFADKIEQLKNRLI